MRGYREIIIVFLYHLTTIAVAIAGSNPVDLTAINDLLKPPSLECNPTNTNEAGNLKKDFDNLRVSIDASSSQAEKKALLEELVQLVERGKKAKLFTIQKSTANLRALVIDLAARIQGREPFITTENQRQDGRIGNAVDKANGKNTLLWWEVNRISESLREEHPKFDFKTLAENLAKGQTDSFTNTQDKDFGLITAKNALVVAKKMQDYPDRRGKDHRKYAAKILNVPATKLSPGEYCADGAKFFIENAAKKAGYKIVLATGYNLSWAADFMEAVKVYGKVVNWHYVGKTPGIYLGIKNGHILTYLVTPENGENKIVRVGFNRNSVRDITHDQPEKGLAYLVSPALRQI